MKNIKYIMLALLMLSSAALFVSCDNTETGAQPTIERVSLVPKDSTTLSGFRGNTYVIFGNNLATTEQVYFNGTLAALNLTYVRNDNIIVTIPSNANYVQAINKIRVVTKFGEAVIDFVVKQPPVIGDFSPAIAADGDIVTINGNYFDEIDSIRFIDAVTGVGVQAEIVSASTTEVQVKVPVGTKVSYISISTPSGTTTATSSFGFNYVIYADKLSDPWQNWSWSSDIDFTSTQKVKSGSASWKQTYTGGWGGIQIHHGSLSLDGFTALKMSIFGGPGTEGKQIGVYINWAKEYRITLQEGVWTDFTIPLESGLGIGSGATLNELIMQDIGNTGIGAPYLMYIDDMGFL